MSNIVFPINLDYTDYDGSGNSLQLLSYYAAVEKLKYDTQTEGQPNKGLVLAKRDVYDNETNINTITAQSRANAEEGPALIRSDMNEAKPYKSRTIGWWKKSK